MTWKEKPKEIVVEISQTYIWMCPHCDSLSTETGFAADVKRWLTCEKCKKSIQLVKSLGNINEPITSEFYAVAGNKGMPKEGE